MKYSVAAVFACLAVSVFGAALPADDHDAKCHGLDCPSYTVLNATKDWELRRYDSSQWIATNASAMNRDDVNTDMFNKLFRYISGNNKQGMKIAMTAPVVTKIVHGAGPNCKSDYIMHFMVPRKYWNQAPIVANDPTVYHVDLPSIDVFVT
jgi:hypothetical protein